MDYSGLIVLMSNVKHQRPKQRLDQYLAEHGLAPTRSQAESLIKLGRVKVNNKIVQKPGQFVSVNDEILIAPGENYVSRAGLKLASVAAKLGITFAGKIVLDVGSSTGGFTDYALQHGASKVIAVDVGTDQLHPTLHGDKRIELHEQLDIRHLILDAREVASHPNVQRLASIPDIILIDVSFISLKEVLPHIKTLCGPKTDVLAMLKPQFEAGDTYKHRGVIKNDTMRRQILKDFESWANKRFSIIDKADSEVTGAKGNRERFYLLRVLK